MREQETRSGASLSGAMPLGGPCGRDAWGEKSFRARCVEPTSPPGSRSTLSTTIEVEQVRRQQLQRHDTAGQRHTATAAHLSEWYSRYRAETAHRQRPRAWLEGPHHSSRLWLLGRHDPIGHRLWSRWRLAAASPHLSAIRTRASEHAAAPNRAARQVRTARAAAGKADSLPGTWAPQARLSPPAVQVCSEGPRDSARNLHYE